MTAAMPIGVLLFVIVLTAVLRRPAHLAALLGVVAAGLATVASPSFGASGAELRAAIGAAGLIVLAAAIVILPGLYLNEQLTRGQLHRQLVAWVERLPMRATHKAPLVVVGVAPALESLTGFGISLLVTVPLLLAISPRRTALRQAMLGMNVMPWGTLALATLIGSALADQPLRDLAFGSALVSALVFPAFGAVAAGMLAPPGRARAALTGATLGATFTVTLLALNWFGIVELSGVLAGVTTTVVGLAAMQRSRPLPRPPWEALKPYALLLALVTAVRASALLGVPTSEWSLVAGGVEFHPLDSPGIALALTALLMRRGRVDRPAMRAAAMRAYKPTLALAGFTVMAQVMVAGGMVESLGRVAPVTGGVTAALVVSFVGMLSGYMTGSNVGGNALMMPVQMTLGEQLGQPLATAAVQNSTAGHAVFASMPIMLLVLAIAGDAVPEEEATLVRYGLTMASLVYALTVLPALGLFLTPALARPS